MMLVKTPTGEIIETNSLEDGTQLTQEDIGNMLASESANVSLYNARTTALATLISELYSKKLLYDNGDAEAIQREIDQLTTEKDLIPSQKAACLSRVTLLTQYA